MGYFCTMGYHSAVKKYDFWENEWNWKQLS